MLMPLRCVPLPSNPSRVMPVPVGSTGATRVLMIPPTHQSMGLGSGGVFQLALNSRTRHIRTHTTLLVYQHTEKSDEF